MNGVSCRICDGPVTTIEGHVDCCLAAAGLVGEGCPWQSVEQMEDDLDSASGAVTYMGNWDYTGESGKRSQRLRAAAALLSSGSNP